MNEPAEDGVAERRHLTFREVVQALTLLLNFGAVIWGAAKISSAVQTLQNTTANLGSTMKDISIQMETVKIDYSTRMGIIETRMIAAEKAIEDLNKKERGY